jgi:cytochrome c biogenesis protein ResB
VIVHLGLVILLVSGFLTLHFSKEFYVSLYEGESSNTASDYMNWELVIIQEANGKISKTSIDEDALKPGKTISVTGLELPIKVKSKYINARYFDTPFAGRILKEMPLEKDYEKNVRALILNLDSGDDIILEGDLEPSHSLSYKGHNYVLLLRRKQYKLPFTIELVDVSRELHPGTGVAKSYQSKVVIRENDIARELTISMNKPFRSGLYTAYQASFAVDEEGNEMTVIAVVRNLNYTLPYIASLICSLGLFIHFGQMFLVNVLRRRDDEA